MNNYVITGIVTPERAQISWNNRFDFKNPITSFNGSVRVNVILNQVIVHVATDSVCDIFDLKLMFYSSLRPRLSAIGFLTGRYYDIEITRAYNPEIGMDYVYGIEDSFADEIMKDHCTPEAEMKIMSHMSGREGVLLSRALTDLASGLRRREDISFYCFRALEGLRHHCSAMHGISDRKRDAQWRKFREVSGANKEDLDYITSLSIKARHGELTENLGADVEKIVKISWKIVWDYINTLEA